MTATIKDDFMQRIATEEAWKSLSEDFAWTEALLEKNCDKVDWKEISGNRNIIWTIPMLQKFSNKLDWKILSENISEEWFTEAHLEVFKDKWDWCAVVCNYNLSEALIDKYIDYIDWRALIGVGRCYGNFPFGDDDDPVAFYEKYKEHIPMAELQDSELWRRLVRKREKQLLSEILS